MENSELHFQLPPAGLFKFPPDASPEVLPVPSKDDSFATPFSISHRLYNKALATPIPFVIAMVYVLGATGANAYNQSRNGKPWAVSQTRLFKAFVIGHNVLLTAFSYFVFLGMVRALKHALPGLHSESGSAGVADALCKIHGPRGLGDAAFWNSTSHAWGTTNSRIYLNQAGLPDSTDVGRLWNEGLAFWGWLFYISKYYEVINTLIILAQGKRSLTLQMYHQAGAMLSMWAGIRYMSPPICLFVLLNSGVQVLVYTFYTMSATGVSVPRGMKRTLTTLQIAQVLIGTGYAMVHFFISYSVPVTVPYTITNKIVSTASAVSSIASSAAISGVWTSATATASNKIGGLLKKIALRAAGEEGLAENIRDEDDHLYGAEAEHLIETLKSETRYKQTWERVSCLDTSGQAFAILLNLVYLLPLTILFIQFFVSSYSNRANLSTAQGATPLGKAAKLSTVAAKKTDRKVEAIGKGAEKEVIELSEQAKKNLNPEHIKEEIGKAEQKIAGMKDKALDAISTNAENAARLADEKAAAVGKKAKDLKKNLVEKKGKKNKSKGGGAAAAATDEEEDVDEDGEGTGEGEGLDGSIDMVGRSEA